MSFFIILFVVFFPLLNRNCNFQWIFFSSWFELSRYELSNLCINFAFPIQKWWRKKWMFHWRQMTHRHWIEIASTKFTAPNILFALFSITFLSWDFVEMFRFRSCDNSVDKFFSQSKAFTWISLTQNRTLFFPKYFFWGILDFCIPDSSLNTSNWF